MKTENIENITIQIPFELTYQRFEDLLCGAIEGGSNYWAKMNSDELPQEIKDEFKGEPFSVKLAKTIWRGYPINVYDVEDDEQYWTITKESFNTGMRLFATDYSQSFADFINENDDANTSDIMFQLITIGEVMFG